MSALRDALAGAPREARKLIVTDGVFSMEGDLAKLPEIVELAGEFEAVVVVDDSHGVGVLGETGRGTVEHFGLLGAVDVITGTLGKALGGAAGGYVAASEEVCDSLAQRSRPQLFSNALPPTACSALRAVQLMLDQPRSPFTPAREHRAFRAMLVEAGYRPLEGEAAIIPIIVGETAAAIALSERLLDEGVFVTGFGFRSSPRERRACGCRCQPRSSPSTSSARSRRSGAFARLTHSASSQPVPDHGVGGVSATTPSTSTAISERSWKKQRRSCTSSPSRRGSG